MSDKTWLERYEAELLRASDERVRLRKLEKAAQQTRLKLLAEERQRDCEERSRRREARKQLCGARTRAGHPCKRKGLGRGGRCPNHGGASTGPKTQEGRARIAAAQRRRWAAWRAVRQSSETCQMISEKTEI